MSANDTMCVVTFCAVFGPARCVFLGGWVWRGPVSPSSRRVCGIVLFRRASTSTVAETV